jgi:multiple sugar transport system substrate-binding protein
VTSQTRRAGVVLAGALLATVLAACGNDVEKKSSPPATSDGGGSPAPTSTAIDTNVQQGAIGQKLDLKNLSPSIPDPDSPTTVTFQSWVGQSVALRSLVAQFEKLHPNIKIKLLNVSADSADQKLATQIAGGNPPDIQYMDESSVGDYAQRGAIIPLDSYIAKSKTVKTNDYVPAFRGSATYNGQMYGLPFDGETTALFYRKDLFAAAGIKKPPTSWEALTADAKRLTDPAKKQYGFIIFGPESAYYWYPWLWQAGGDLTSPDGKTMTFNNAAGKRAAAFYTGLRKYSPPDQYNSNSWDGRTTFANGKVAMYVAGAWLVNTLNEQFPKIKGKWDVAPLPVDKQCGTTSAGDALVVLKNSKHPDAAWKWIEFLSAPQNMALMTVGTKKHPASLIPPRASLLDDPKTFVANPILKGFAQQMKCAKTNTTANPKWPQIEQKLNDELAKVIFGKKNVTQALNDAAAAGQKIMAKNS